MKIKYGKSNWSLLLLLLAVPSLSFSQEQEFYTNLYDSYEEFKEETFSERRINHEDIQPLLEKYKDLPEFTVQKAGESIEGRDLSLVSIGKGDIDVFLWSQMHGDESTATMALFDIFNFFASASFEKEKQGILKNLRVHFLPMLNPDGAEVFQRRNALGIDVNRDALRLQSPEGRTLKRIRDSLDADFGFNLHDQSRYYNAEGTAKPATISFLAPAYDFEKSINKKRGDALKLIIEINKVLQKHIPGQVGRYNDDFEPRAFGDNIQKWGTRTVLIESGGNFDDPEKQEIRKLNFLAILSALSKISDKSFRDANISEYEKIPHNDSKLFDLKLIGVKYELEGDDYVLDLGINHAEISEENEKGFYYQSSIADQGDLSTNYGYRTEDVSGYRVRFGAVYPQVLQNMAEIEKLDFLSILKNGYTYVRVRDIPENLKYISYPFHVVAEDFKEPTKLSVGANPTFFLEKNGNNEFAVINGFFVKLEDVRNEIKNGLIIN